MPSNVKLKILKRLFDAAGGFCISGRLLSGSVLALEAVARLPDKVKKLVMYEPPFVVDDSRPPVGKDFAQNLTRAHRRRPAG